MKKIVLIALTVLLVISATDCENKVTETKTDVTLTIVTDEFIEVAAQIDGEVSPEKLIDALASETGYVFDTRITSGDGEITVKWLPETTFRQAMPENAKYTFTDVDGFYKILFDSTYFTLLHYYGASAIFFGTPDAGNGLSFTNDELVTWLYPGTEPYSGDFESYYPSEDISGSFPVYDNVEYPPERLSYDALDNDVKAIYDEVYAKITAFEDFSLEAATFGYDYIDNVYVAWSAMINDEPSIDNYFTFYEVCDYDAGGILTSLESRYIASWNGSTDKDEIKAGISAFEKECDAIVGNLDKNLTTAEQYIALASELCVRAAYQYSGVTAENTCAYGPIITGNAVCQGYAQAFQILCNKAGLWCRTVSGASHDEGHMWNIVKLSTGTYYLEITWADENGLPGDENWLNYMFLTQEQLLSDHEIFDGTVATGTYRDTDTNGDTETWG